MQIEIKRKLETKKNQAQLKWKWRNVATTHAAYQLWQQHATRCTDCQGKIKIKATRAGCTLAAAAAQFARLQMGNNCSTCGHSRGGSTGHSTWMATCHQNSPQNITPKCRWLSLFSSSAVLNSLDAAARSYKHTYHTSSFSRLPTNWIMRAARWRTRCFR